MSNDQHGRPMPGANALKIGVGDDAPHNVSPQHDNTPGVLERAMANTDAEPELGAQVNRSDEGSSGTVLNADGTVETWKAGAIQGSSADVETGVPVFKAIVSPNGDQRQTIHDASLESRITLQNGMEMTIRSALEAGFISQQSDGTFVAGPVDSTAQANKDADENKDLDAGDAGEFLPEADEAVMKEIIDNTSAQDQVSIINDITSGDGTMDPNTINRAASEAGVEPSVMAGKINSVAEAMKTQASAVVAKHGVDPEAVWTWANEPANLPTLQAAVRKHAMERSPAAYGDIAKAYILAMNEHSPDAILSADLGEGIRRTYRDQNGAIILEDASGRGYTWKSAIRSGLVKLA